MIRASIDLGTHTCLLLVTEWTPGDSEPVRILGDFATIVRLGQGVDKNRELNRDAIIRARHCLNEYALTIKALGGRPEDTICVATSQARDARNGKDFFENVQREFGFRFQVLSGEREAQLTFLGALLPGMDPNRCAVIDIGGGSTELMSLLGGKSVDVGSVRFTERYLASDPVTDVQFWSCQHQIDESLEAFLLWRKTLGLDAQLVAVAGTATTLASCYLGLTRFNADKIDEVILTRGDVHRLVEELKWRTVRERLEMKGMEKGREDVILGGALILWRAMEMLQFSECWVSTRGLRFGVLKALQ